MFQLTKKNKLYEEHKVLASIAGSIDELDRYEASDDDALGSCVLTTLKTMGYKEETAMVASLMTVKALENDFRPMYWKENSFSHKVAIFVSIVETAREQIKRKAYDKRTTQIVKLALEDIKKNDSDKATNK